jgi:hypothetical protein
MVGLLPAADGELFQVAAVWILGRRWWPLILTATAARAQARVGVPMALLMFVRGPWGRAPPDHGVAYQLVGNALLPAWRALMADPVLARRRGRWFAGRTRTAMIVASSALVLDDARRLATTGVGLGLVLMMASVARLISAHHLARMHDPAEEASAAPQAAAPWIARNLPHSDFLRFSLFVATFQGVVAVAGPFFAVHLLEVLDGPDPPSLVEDDPLLIKHARFRVGTGAPHSKNASRISFTNGSVASRSSTAR